MSQTDIKSIKKSWYHEIVKDLSNILPAIQYFNSELEHARHTELCMKKKIIEDIAVELPGVVEYRFNQLQEIEAILNFLNIGLRKLRSQYFKKYLENYQRALSSRDVEKYVDGESEIVDYESIINEFALVRNQWLGLLKSLDILQWQLTNIVKLRVAGLDDAAL